MHGRIHDLRQSPPTVEVPLAHPFLDRGQHPTGCRAFATSVRASRRSRSSSEVLS